MTRASAKHEEIKCAVESLFATKPDWVTFYREVLGLQGLVRRAFPTFTEMAAFEQTETYRQIHLMVTELRRQAPPGERRGDPDRKAGETTDDSPIVEPDEPGKTVDEETRIITVRIPKSLHNALRKEAFEHSTSLNKLCISKLLHFVAPENVPTSLELKKAEAGL